MTEKFNEDLEFGNYYQSKFIKYKQWKKCKVKEGYFKAYDLKDDDKNRWEVKTDRKTKDTGNICIEFECSGKLSGISTTRSKYYAYLVIQDINNEIFDIYEIPTIKIKEYIEGRKYSKIVKGGDGYKSRFYLFDVKLFKEFLKT